jgi:probable rRNA maturation factor
MRSRIMLPDDPDPDARGETAADFESVVVSITEIAWEREHADWSAICETAAVAVLGHPRSDADTVVGETTIVLADDATVQQLNRDFRGIDKPTNVLSFIARSPTVPATDAPLGDVILGLETVQRECRELGIPLGDHVRHLVVHGCLHLLGHDHESDRDAEHMENLETEILAGLGVPDPYRAREVSMETERGEGT